MAGSRTLEHLGSEEATVPLCVQQGVSTTTPLRQVHMQLQGSWAEQVGKVEAGRPCGLGWQGEDGRECGGRLPCYRAPWGTDSECLSGAAGIVGGRGVPSTLPASEGPFLRILQELTGDTNNIATTADNLGWPYKMRTSSGGVTL